MMRGALLPAGRHVIRHGRQPHTPAEPAPVPVSPSPPPSQPSGSLQPGDRIEVPHNGVLFAATLVYQQGGYCAVDWDDGTHSVGVPLDTVRTLPTTGGDAEQEGVYAEQQQLRHSNSCGAATAAAQQQLQRSNRHIEHKGNFEEDFDEGLNAASHLATAHLTASHLAASHLAASHLAASHLAASHLDATWHLAAAHLAASHLAASHLAASHRGCEDLDEEPDEAGVLPTNAADDVPPAAATGQHMGCMESTTTGTAALRDVDGDYTAYWMS